MLPGSFFFNVELIQELERETGIEPATNGLGSRDSTTELLPLALLFSHDNFTPFAIVDNGFYASHLRFNPCLPM